MKRTTRILNFSASPAAKTDLVPVLYSLLSAVNFLKKEDALTLTVLLCWCRFNQPGEFLKIQHALQTKDVDSASCLLDNLYQQQKLSLPFSKAHFLDIFRMGKPETNLSRFSELFHGLSNEQYDAHQLSHSLYQLIRQNTQTFETQVLSSNSLEFIEALLTQLNLPEHVKIMDGAASFGLLLQHFISEDDEVILTEQSEDRLLLSKLILSLRGISSVTFNNHNPLCQETAVISENADIYLSFPKQPYALSVNERNADHFYLPEDHHGLVNRNSADALWIQYGLFHLNQNGKLLLVVRDGFLSRLGYDLIVRKQLIQKNLVDCVVHLNAHPSFKGQHLSLLVLDKSRTLDSLPVRVFDLRSLSAYERHELDIDMIINSTQEAYEAHVDARLIPNIRMTLSFKAIQNHHYSLDSADYRQDLSKDNHQWSSSKITYQHYQETYKDFCKQHEKLIKLTSLKKH
ncbi:N-6 DNA methylase [Hydrogenovibrio kuenenii]|uniref:N-6 DNA methylase n=1 Tax=Hydrogenovibrio kuenenii TaxID=63658 RepID=UPI000463B023|nr:N-6 DNA methylase [Hydrogenovibrio kuenenii]